VLLDRIFDLAILLLVGMTALFQLKAVRLGPLSLIGPPLLLVGGLALFLSHWGYEALGRLLGRFSWATRLLAEGSWMHRLRAELKCLTWHGLLYALALTFMSYSIFFTQCYLLAQSLGLGIGYSSAASSAALGSLVALLPVSIAGLGTREAAIVGYLGLRGVSADRAVGFSLLIFLVFHVGSALYGLIAWWLKPMSFNSLAQLRSHRGTLGRADQGGRDS
jgi:uncharacterized membrane protein YbhN (UPF0104 family)